MPPTKVRLFTIQRRGDGRARPYLVRWQVGARQFSEGFAVKAQAEDLRAELLRALRGGEAFSEETGRPASWSPDEGLSVARFARDWVVGEAPTLKHASVLSIVEVLVDVLPVLVGPRAGAAPEDLRAELRAWLLNTGDEPAWLAAHSMPVATIGPEQCVELERLLSRRADGAPAAPTTATRRVNTARQLVSEAVRAGHLEANPWPAKRKGRKRVSQTARTKDWRTVPTHAEVKTMLAELPEHLVPLYALIYYAGLRPSEAAAIHVEDLKLGRGKAWGTVRVERAVEASPGANRRAVGRTKTGTTREVPMAPQLADLLRPYLKDRTAGLLVATDAGLPMTASVLDRHFRKARLRSDWTPYWLRHAAATAWLAAGVPIVTAARWLGHDPEVLVSTYAGTLPGDEKLARDRIAAALDA